MLSAAFPDLRIKIEDIVAEGDRINLSATWSGTRRGPLSIVPVPVANCVFAIMGMVFWRIRDRKIVERGATLHRLGFQQQFTPKS
jgi:predicted ester cyclase